MTAGWGWGAGWAGTAGAMSSRAGKKSRAAASCMRRWAANFAWRSASFSALCGGFLGGDALLFGKAFRFCGFLGGEGCGESLLFLLFGNRLPAVGRPGREETDASDDVAEADREQDGEEREAGHQHAGPKRGEEAREAARHHEVADRSSCVGRDVERHEQRMEGRTHAQQLQQAGDCQHEQRHADRPAAGME